MGRRRHQKATTRHSSFSSAESRYRRTRFLRIVNMRTALVLFFVMLSNLLFAAPIPAPEGVIAQLYHGWDKIKYQTPEKDQEKGFEKLKKQADDFLQQYPEDATLLVWKGIITSTYAGAAGGLKALGAVKEARSA